MSKSSAEILALFMLIVGLAGGFYGGLEHQRNPASTPKEGWFYYPPCRMVDPYDPYNPLNNPPKQ